MSAPDSLLVLTDPTTTASGATRAAPTVVGDGLDLSNLKSYRVIISAAGGQTLSGAGSMQAWLFDPQLGIWERNPSLDFNVTATSRAQVSPEYDVNVRAGAVLFTPAAVTCSGGVLTTTIEGSKVQA